MEIRCINHDGIISYSTSDIENIIKKERGTFLLDDNTCRRCPKTIHQKDGYMYQDSVIDLMTFIHKDDGILMCLAVREFIKQQRSKCQKRAYSTTHRIEIAYKCKYKCNMCDIMLPSTFEVDHIVELQDGGKDEYSNLQALCCNCHAEKTRANVLRRDKAFKEVYEKKFIEMQENAFNKFKYNGSKYF
jgi:5-methylcytosine-specific restriction endonuclease McrA